MILSIRLRYPTLNPEQTRRCLSPNFIYPYSRRISSPKFFQTTRPSIPPNHPNPLLIPRSKPCYPNMNWRPTSRIPIYYHRPNRLNLLLHYYCHPDTYSQHNRKQHYKNLPMP